MEDARFMRAAALWCAIGSVINLVLLVIDVAAPDFFGTPGMATSLHIVLIVMNAMVLAGIVGLARSGAVGSSLVGRIALGVALLGQSLFIVAELAGIAGAKSTDQTLYGIGSALIAFGMTTTGILVLTSKRWQGWHSWTPLPWGLYLLVVLLVVVVAGRSAAILAVGLWTIPSLLVSVALWQEAGERRASQPSLAG